MDKPGLLKTVRLSISAVCLYTLSFTGNAQSSGSLSTPDGIDGLGSWGAGLTTLSWETQPPAYICCDTLYTYTFEHPEANTFEVIIEVHPDMVAEPFGTEIYDVNSTLPNWELGIFTPSVSTPGMPDTIPGVRFWGDSGSTIEIISFRSDYLPMWGDFYATDTNAVAAAWNTGFTNPDTDPSQFPGDGSVDFHILAPGLGGIPIVPVPPAVWLFSSGLLGLVSMARSKKAA